MRYFVDAEERAIATNFAAVSSALMAGHIVKTISTEGPCPRGAVKSEATRQDVEAAVNEGMKTQVIIDGRQLFVCEVIDKHFEKEHMEESNENADKCYESQEANPPSTAVGSSQKMSVQ